ncbi:hypothetical protein V490_05433 [Pseudogymnoascus sp. VKM F-3557]|nr:hypothetical protein V490_05433 [Pseudogymnoascus sp. VKM F-3557]
MAQELSSSVPAQPVIKRAVTLPLRPSTSSNWTQREKPASSDDIESLYLHPSVRIVSFESYDPSSGFQRRSSLNTPNLADVKEEVGTLPYSSTFERTIAVGPLRIYRAPGSVAFIHCSSVIQPVLPKSRCWCVDDDSTKFILQIRRPQFWRIEVPLDDPNHEAKSQELKDVLSQILLFEKTPCPFRRNFHIELPEPPQTPVKKKPWRPVERPGSANADPKSANTESPVDVSPKSGKTEDYYAAASSDDTPAVPEMDTDSDATDDTNITPRNYFPRVGIPHIFKQEPLTRPEVLDTGRSVTAPPQLTLMTSPPSKNTKGVSLGSPVGRKSEDSTLSSFSSSQDSFHTVQSWHSPITPVFSASSDSRPSTPTTYPYPHENIKLPKRNPEPQNVSELTISPSSETPTTPGVWTMVDTPENKSSGTPFQSSPPSPTTPIPAHKSRNQEDQDEEIYQDASPSAEVADAETRTQTSVSERSSRRRALSPLPSPANLFSPSRSRARHLRTARHLPTAIIQKTWEILMSPPSHLVQIMVEIAAKIKAGQWRGAVFGVDEGGEEVVGQWDYEDGDFMCDQWDDAEVDDYGTTKPLRVRYGVEQASAFISCLLPEMTVAHVHNTPFIKSLEHNF